MAAKFPRKLSPAGDWDSDWPGHKECQRPGPKEQLLIAARELGLLTEFGSIVDQELTYEFDEWSLVKVEGEPEFYLLRTSGCSCPSPREVWGVDYGPASLAEVVERVETGAYGGFSLPTTKKDEFLAMLRSWW